MKTYLSINKFIVNNVEFGSKGPFTSINDEQIGEFENHCFFAAESFPHVDYYGISRIMSGWEIKNLLLEDNNKICYSYYDKKLKKRKYYEAFSFSSYKNINEKSNYRIEVNISIDTFNIYNVDEE